jgi:hypothetical protein
MTINLSIPNPTTVYTLINTGGGWPGPPHKGAIEFKGSGGAYYAKVLVGDYDMRENYPYCNNPCTTSINGTTTTNVWTSGNYVLDMQTITLPPEFQSQSLTQIILLDWDIASAYSFVALAGVTVASTSSPVASAVTTVPVDFSSSANCRLQSNGFFPINDLAYPEGSVWLGPGGVRFDIGPVGGTNAWSPWYLSAHSAPTPYAVTIPVNIPNATAVHTLINTSWGFGGSTPSAKIEFYGSEGGYQSQYLFGDSDFRTNSNYSPIPYTCCINGTSTINVYSDPPGYTVGGWATQLDMQTFALALGGQNLTQIVITDLGGYGSSWITVGGVSVDVTPAAKATPVITWSNPADIVYGTALGSTQLNATANVPGTFVYTPAPGTVLTAGANQTLSTTFTPTDTTDYTTATKSVLINVSKATPVITWSNPADIVYGTALGPTQLNPTASVPGTFAYNPAPGTVLTAGTGQTLSTTFTPTDTADYTTATKSVLINVSQATPVITWAAPAPITYGGALGNGQLDASANTPGTFVYTPPAGTVLPVGNGQTLSVAFTPSDAVDYTTASATTPINVTAAPPPPSGVNLVVTKVLSRAGGNVVVLLTIANTGGTPANNVTLTSVKVGALSATPLPQNRGTIGASASVQATVGVPGSVGVSGAASSLTAAGTYTGGTFSLSMRITLP